MENLASGLLNLAKRSLTEPRAAARVVMSMGLAPSTRWLALALAAVLSALLLHTSLSLLPVADRQTLIGVPDPFESALAQGGLMILMAVLAHRVGRWRGGDGNFADALILVVWLQTVFLGLQVLQIAALLVAPVLASLLGLVGIALFFWMMASFVAELHGFQSLAKVLLGIIGTMIAAAGLVSILILPLITPGAGG